MRGLNFLMSWTVGWSEILICDFKQIYVLLVLCVQYKCKYASYVFNQVLDNQEKTVRKKLCFFTKYNIDLVFWQVNWNTRTSLFEHEHAGGKKAEILKNALKIGAKNSFHRGFFFEYLVIQIVIYPVITNCSSNLKNNKQTQFFLQILLWQVSDVILFLIFFFGCINISWPYISAD